MVGYVQCLHHPKEWIYKQQALESNSRSLRQQICNFLMGTIKNNFLLLIESNLDMREPEQ